MSAEQVVRLPDYVTEEQAAALMLKGCTAEYCLFRLHRLQPGEAVLVHAAAGGLGMLAAQWARALGARVIGTVGSEDKARIARAYCDQVIVGREPRFADAVLDATHGRGARLIVDGLGEPARNENMRAIAATGHWISVGQAGGPMQPIEPAWFSGKSVTFSRPVVFHYLADARVRGEMTSRVFDALADGRLRPQITRYALTAAADAHRDLEARRTSGQVILLA
jgi:NADPH:quinone reductase-like Zn-dependent oxidoreductase